MKFPVKEILILLYLASGYRGMAARFESLGLSPALFLYLLLFGLLTAGLLLAAQVRNAPLRWLYALILSASALFSAATERIMGDHLSYDVFVNLLNSIGFAGDAADQHQTPIVAAAVAALLLFAGVALKPRFVPAMPRAVAAAAPIAAILGLAGILFLRGGEGARGLPGAFTPLAYSSLYLLEDTAAGPRQEVSLAVPAARVQRDIVLIVDESVVGDYLDINSPQGVRTGLNEPRAGLRIRNYGHAAAITNCSVGTNLTLRYGGTRADYRRINATMPAIWDYARRAGLRTVYVDAQRTGGALQNLMTGDEVKRIDRFVQFDSVRVRDRDMTVADTLAALSRNKTPEFVLVNKMGAHFPVADKYPDSFLRYRPVLPRGGQDEVVDTGSREGFGGNVADWRRYRNSYRNTLLWNVGAFFDRLFAKADLSATTILYTSDHGQDLHVHGRAGTNTHCTGDPVPEEGLVPLVVIEGGESLDWDRHFEANRDRVSHYQVFPTLLALMGYDPQAVRAEYGDSLVARSTDPRTFNTRFNARLGRDPAWKPIPPPAAAGS